MLIFLNWILNKCAIADKLEAGRKSIEDKIRNSKAQKEEALKTLYELQEKTQEVDKEAHDILAKSNENAVMVGEKIIADAKKQAQEFGKNLDKLSLNEKIIFTKKEKGRLRNSVINNFTKSI